MRNKLSDKYWILIIFNLLILGQSFLGAQTSTTLDSLQQAFKQSDDYQSKIEIYNEIMVVYVQQSDSANAIQYFQLALNLSKKHSSLKGVSQTHLTIANLYFDKKTDDSLALFHLQEGLYAAQQSKNLALQAQAYKVMGIVYRRKGHYNLSLQNYQLAMKLYQNLKDEKGIATIQNNMGNLYGDTGNFALALDYMLKSLKYWEDTNDIQKTGRIYNNIGLIHMEQTDYMKALSYFFKSLEIVQSLNSQIRIARVSNNLGITFEALEDYNKSRFYYQKALSIYQTLDNSYGIARVSHNLGLSYCSGKEYNKALAYFEKALEIRKQLDTKVGVASTFIQVGEVYRLLKNYEKAESFLNQGKELAQRIQKLDKVQIALSFLAKLHYDKGEYRQAYQAHLKSSQLSDSLFNIESIRETTLVDANHEFQQQIDSLEQVKEQETITLRENQINHRWWFALFIVSIVALILLILILIIRYKQIRQAMELQKVKEQLLQEQLYRKEIEEKNLQTQLQTNQQTQTQLQLDLEDKDFELTRQALYLVQKQQLLDKVSEEMKDISKSDNQSTKEKLKELIKTIRKETSNNEEWQNFTQTFEIAHPGFFQRLQQQFPELTYKDLKLAALLRLGFDSGELSLILNIALDSVRKARIRLRKKLKIKEEDLLKFMRDF